MACPGAGRASLTCCHTRQPLWRPRSCPLGPACIRTSPSFVAGETGLAGERLQFALATLYDADADFRAAANETMPDLAELRLGGSAPVGARLEQQLLGLLNGQQQAGDAAAAPAAAASAGPADGGSGGQEQAPQPPEGKAG